MIYVPPKTNSWGTIEYKAKLEDTERCVEAMMASKDDLMIMGDFNCKEVRWEEWSVDGSEESWGGKLLRMATENSMTQWVEQNTRYRGDDEPSRLDLIFTSEPEVVEDVRYKCPLGKTDHVVLECDLRIE